MAFQLAQLPEVQRISPLVIRILGGNPGKFTLQGTNTYIVGEGPHRLLIDTGEGRPSWIKAVRMVLHKEKAAVVAAIITHWHHDHVGGVSQLREAYPNVTVYKHLPEDDQLDIKDGQKFSVKGATLRAVFSPGHTRDHMTLILEEEDAMFTGDNVLGHGTAIFENLSEYVASLEKMRHMFSGRAYPGHGPVVEDGKIKVVEYIRHRQQRENQVIELLKSSKSAFTSPDCEGGAKDWASTDIVRELYKEVPESLHGPANGGIIQVLTKLENEGKVIRDSSSQRWTAKDRMTL
ncbi:MAG: hypothetical protein M1818_003138 [Claussenomyces sp. TS43310]|nr:MAG: hypothetical protein M1818_003138 [Claussenomyces sp. TS43310]